MSAIFSCDLGKGSYTSDNIDSFLGRLIKVFDATYTVTEIKWFQGENNAARDVSFFVVTMNTEDGRPTGQWANAAGISEPGTTFLCWDQRTDYRESAETCKELARLAREADEDRRREEEEAEREWRERRKAARTQR